MGIEGQGHFFTIYFPGFVCFVLYKATVSGERLQDHWSSGLNRLLTAVGIKKSFDIIGLSVYSQQCHEDRHYQQINQKNLALCMQFKYIFCTNLCILISAARH